MAPRAEQQHYLETRKKCKVLGPTADLLNQTLQGGAQPAASEQAPRGADAAQV